MRTFAAVAMLAIAALLTPVSALAQPINGSARWCVTLSHFGGTLDCAYHTFEQCMAAASGVSHGCTANPWYVGRRDLAPCKRDLRR